MDEARESLRHLPQVDRVIDALGESSPHALAAEAARRAIDEARARVLDGHDLPSFDDVVDVARSMLRRGDLTMLTSVVNATGVIAHTNLGRAPMAREHIHAVGRVAAGYSNLEFDLEPGRRGSRYAHARRLLVALTGAESALVVNNNAAAVLLTLSALCHGREVIISRGELIEIGGEFRIPDVMRLSGARLVEVGTTNRTHLADYERAITRDTAAILKVHPSNYRVVGFATSVPGRDLARLARGRGLTFLHDLGSGLIASSDKKGILRDEPAVEPSLEDGADLVMFSGDKLLGGPQCGVIAGRSALVQSIEHHPMLRALRVDKMTLAALEATLLAHLEGRPEDLPLWRMLNMESAELRLRAMDLAARIESSLGGSGVKAEAIPTQAVTGGGSLPGLELDSWGVALRHPDRSSDDLARSLRHGSRPVIGRIEDDTLILDLRTVPPDQDAHLPTILIKSLSS